MPDSIDGLMTKTSSLIEDAAQQRWSTHADPRWIADWTCRGSEHMAMAILHGGDDIRAIRVAGADTTQLREAYLQGRRFSDGIAELEQSEEYVAGWIATAGWRPQEHSIGGRTVDLYPGEDEDLYVYVVGDTIFEVEAEATTAEEIIGLLPAPGADTSVFGPPVEPAPSDCPGPSDAGLQSLLPTFHDDIDDELDPWPAPYSLVAQVWPRFVKVTDASPSNLSAYLYSVPVSMGAFRITGADATMLERGCAALYESRRKELAADEVGGQRILRVRDSGTSCFVRDDMLFFFPDTYTTWVLRSASAS